MTRVILSLKWALAVLAFLALAFLSWIYLSTYHPADEQAEPVTSLAGPMPKLRAGQEVKVLSWNIQFLAGNRDNHFFFTGGTDPWPNEGRVFEVADEVAAIILDEDPDVVLLQEVDEGADRTHGHNQTQMLLDRLKGRYPTYSETYYWKADFVPHPAVMGSAGMKLVTLSKYKIDKATRQALPLITSDDWLTRQFSLKRAILSAQMPVEGGTALDMMNIHQSAFAQGDDTMARQVARVMDLLAKRDKAGAPWILGGDFNLLPDQSVYDAMPDARRTNYNPAGTELAPMMARYGSLPSLAEATGPNKSSFYSHSPANDPMRQPDKTIDYIFHSDTLTIGAHKVRQRGTRLISDHLPLVAIYRLP